MMVYIGSDHRGFELKEKVREYLDEEGYDVEDLGAYEFDPEDDYVDFAEKVAKAVSGDPGSRGILLCGSGHGMDMVANRFREVRAILGFNREVVVQGREHEDANVLVLASDWVEEAEELVRLFLTSEASKDTRHVRRRQKIGSLRTA